MRLFVSFLSEQHLTNVPPYPYHVSLNLNVSDIANEMSSYLGFGKTLDEPNSKKDGSGSEKYHVPTESELALSKRLVYDREAENEEIVPCCTYFCWGSYIACCTDDVNSLKLLGVYVKKKENAMIFEHSSIQFKSCPIQLQALSHYLYN